MPGSEVSDPSVNRERKTIWMAAALVATAAALAAPAGATAKLLDDYYNEGIEPHADLGASRPMSQPRQLKVEFTGSSPQQQINAEFTVKCVVHGKTRFSRAGTPSGVSPIVATIPIKGRFDSCRVSSAESRYADSFITGWLRIRVFGTPR
jgi:hypothetical protein